MSSAKMESEFLVSGQGSWITKLTFIATIGLIVVGWMVPKQQPGPGIAFTVLFGPIAVALFVIGIYRWWNRKWIRDLETGFEIRDRRRSFRYDDDDIIQLHVYAKDKYIQGNLSSTLCVYRIKVVGRDKPWRLVYRMSPKRQNLGILLFNRLVLNFIDRAHEAWKAGVKLQGEGWELKSKELTYQVNKRETCLNLLDASAVDVIGDQILVWKKGEDVPVFSIPFESENGYLLTKLLTMILEENGGSPAVDYQAPGMGRLLFERSASRGSIIGAYIALALVLMCIVVFFVAMRAPWVDIPVWGIVFFAVLTLGLAACVWMSLKRFRCYERGVQFRNLFFLRELRFEDLHRFSFAVTRHYHNGIYIGTGYVVKFEPEKGSGKRPIHYSASTRSADASLDALQPIASSAMKQKMARQLAEEGEVEWLPHLRITRDGLRYKPTGFIKRKEEMLLPWQSIYNFQIQEGTLHVWELNHEKSVVFESVNQPNFFPGYYLLVDMLYSQGTPGNPA